MYPIIVQNLFITRENLWQKIHVYVKREYKTAAKMQFMECIKWYEEYTMLLLWIENYPFDWDKYHITGLR